MEQNAKKKKITALIILCFIVVSFLSSLYVAKEIDHECVGERCSICAHIHEAENIIKQLGSLVVGFINILGIIFALFFLTDMLDYNKIFLSPITRKVRMNN